MCARWRIGARRGAVMSEWAGGYAGDVVCRGCWEDARERVPRRRSSTSAPPPSGPMSGCPSLAAIGKATASRRMGELSLRRPVPDFRRTLEAELDEAGHRPPTRRSSSSAGRAAAAAMRRSRRRAAGYSRCFNVAGGFEGRRDRDGHRGPREAGRRRACHGSSHERRGRVRNTNRGFDRDLEALTVRCGDCGGIDDAGREAAGRGGRGGEAMRSNGMRVKQRLRAELGEDVFSSWFARVEFEEADAGIVRLSVPTRFLKAWIKSHYGDKLLGAVARGKDRRGSRSTVRGTVRARRSAAGRRAGASQPRRCRRRDASRRRAAGDPSGRRASPARRSIRASPSRPSARAPPTTSPCRGARGRGARRSKRDRLQSALHPRRRRPRQDASAPGDRAARRGAPIRAATSVYLTAEHFMCRFVARAPRPVGDRLQGAPARRSTSCSSTTCSSCRASRCSRSSATCSTRCSTAQAGGGRRRPRRRPSSKVSTSGSARA